MKNIVALLLLILSTAAYGQDSPVTLEYEYNDSSPSIDIVSQHKSIYHGTISLVVEFTDVDNCTLPPMEMFTSQYPGRRIKTVKPLSDSAYPKFLMSYSVVYGAIDPKVDEKIVYRIPAAEGRGIRVRSLTNLNEKYLRDTTDVDWRAFQFVYTGEDTVFAMRKGIVTKITDQYDYTSKKSYSSYNNSINIEHPDGTESRYGMLKKDGMLVKEGDVVYPDTPIAIAGNITGDNFETRVVISYLFKKENGNKNRFEVRYAYLDPIFATSEGNVILEANKTYTPVLPPDVLTAEMTSREKKKLSPKK